LLEDLQGVQHDISVNDFLKDLYTRKIEIKVEIDSMLSHKELINREKSRIKWFGEGDRNSAFFHALMKRRKVNKGIAAL